jgi:hypothetical protein
MGHAFSKYYSPGVPRRAGVVELVFYILISRLVPNLNPFPPLPERERG